MDNSSISSAPAVSIVVPCYNEQAVIEQTAAILLDRISALSEKKKISPDSKLYFVDDGSTDGSWLMIEGLAKNDTRLSGIKLSRNRGHQNALLAGLSVAEGDALISIDADLQDDVNAIEEMVDHFRDGYDVVYGVRRRRATDAVYKRVSAKTFYRLIEYLGAESVYNHADFRLMSRRAVEALKGFQEVNLFLRGLVPLVGFRFTIVQYDRGERLAGRTKYSPGRMFALALDAITSFSVLPLRIISLIGGLVFLFASVMSLWVLWIKAFTNQAIPGWASTVLPIYFLGGIQLLCTGVVGEYLGKTYAEVKRRPRYIIEKIV